METNQIKQKSKTMIKFKRQDAGSYIAHTKSGICTIVQGKDKKWWIDFPCGKRSYRTSYSGAKAWAEKYLERQESAIVAQQTKAKVAKKEGKVRTLKDKLSVKNAYVTGHEYYGCVNSGRQACILHLSVNFKSYYLVGFEVDVTDTIIYKNVFKIRQNIAQGWVEDYVCQNENTIQVFSNFKLAEKAYRALDQKTIDFNEKARKEVSVLRGKVKNNTADFNDYFALSDYGAL